jgi:hypothetical protein
MVAAGIEKRMAFNRIIKAYANKLRQKRGNFRASESTLKSIVKIENTTNYEFPLLTTETNNGKAIRTEEIRLSTNDDFVVTEHGLYLYGYYEAERGNEATREYFALSYVPIELGQASQLSALFNGTMEVSINNDIILKGYDTNKFNRIPHEQFNDKLNSGEALTLQPTIDFTKLISIEPNLNLSGAKTNKIKITLPKVIQPFNYQRIYTQNDQIVIDSIMYVARGILIQNVASFQK